MKSVPQALRRPAPAGPVVLDTHVALEWLWFADPRTAPLGQAIESGQRRWWVCARMQQEWARVLRRLALPPGEPSAPADPSEQMPCLKSKYAHTCFIRWGQIWRLTPPAAPWRCTDPDDQMFIDLGLAAGARCLLTRDRALLNMRTRAREHGLLIGAPEDWCWIDHGP